MSIRTATPSWQEPGDWPALDETVEGYPIAAGGSGDLTGSYKLRVTESNPDEYTADKSTTGRATVGGSVAGEIAEPGDVDWFAVDLVAGRAYKIDLEGTWSAPGQILDPALKGIHDEDGNLIPGTEVGGGGSGLDARLYFTATETSTHYIAAGAAANTNYHVGTYDPSIEDIGVDDGYSADTSTSGRIAVGGTASGNISEPWGWDWFAVAFVAGTAYRIDLKGSPTGDGTLTDPCLRGVYDAGGSFVAGTLNNDGGAAPIPGWTSRRVRPEPTTLPPVPMVTMPGLTSLRSRRPCKGDKSIGLAALSGMDPAAGCGGGRSWRQ